MHDFTALFEALRSMFSSNEQIDTMKAHIIIQNKDNLLNVISNKPRDSTHHDTIARADRDGIQIEGIPERRKLPRTVIEECFALSDLFDIDEHQSLLILLEGESLLPNYPDCTRGLLAVQLYYESKERLSACLAYLMAGIRGRTFQPLIKSEDLIDFCSHFVDELVSQRLIENIVDQLIRFQFSTEEQKLYSKAGLGNVRHRRRVYDYIRNVRCFQSKALFLYSCQVRLNQSHIMAIINYLAKYTTVQEDGVIDDSALYLLGAFLYGITLKTTSATTQSIHKQQFSLQEDQPLSPSTPLTAGTTIDPAFITAIHDTLTSDERWVIPELKAVCQLAWAITLRARLQALTEAGINNAEDIETLADMAVESHVFAFMIHTVIKSPLFQQEEFIIRRFHVLFVDFIYYLPFKLKELRVQAEDTARTIEDCERFGKVLPDNLPRDYEYLLELLSKFYANDPMKLQLCEEFWCASDALAQQRMINPPTQQQVALSNFVESAGGTLSAYLYCHYMHMLAGISSTQLSAHACFSLLRFAKDTGGPTCWNRIFQAFQLYRNTYRPEIILSQQQQQQQPQLLGYTRSPSKTIAPKEVTALLAVLNLIEVITTQDEISRISFFEHSQWQITSSFFGLISCKVSLDLKSSLFNTLAAFTKTPEIAVQFWKLIGDIDLFAPLEHHDVPAIVFEIEEHEVPSQKYPFLRSCLNFLKPILITQIKLYSNTDTRTLGHCVVFLVNHVLLKLPVRIFKSLQEKWQIAETVLFILYEIVSVHFSNRLIEYDSTNELQNVSPASLLVTDLLRGGALYTLLITLINDGYTKLAEYTSFTGEQELSKTLVHIMKLFELITLNSLDALQSDKTSSFSFSQTPIERMLTETNTKQHEKQELFLNIMRFIDMIDYFPLLASQSLSIFSKAVSEDNLQKPFLRLLPKDHKDKALLRNGLVRCIEFTEPDFDTTLMHDVDNDDLSFLKSQMRQTVLWLLTKSIRFLTANQSNIGLYLCGFTRQLQLEPIDYYLTLTGKSCRVNNCLNSILSFLDDLSLTSSSTQLLNYKQTIPMCYEVLYNLCCTNNNVCKITFDLLHEQYFLQKQIQLYLPIMSTTEALFKLSFETYLLRLITLDLFHLQNDDSLVSKNIIQTTINLLFDTIDIKKKSRLTNLLTMNDFSICSDKRFDLSTKLKTPNIDMTKIEHVLKACTYVEKNNLKLYRIDSLRKFLTNELKYIQRISMTSLSSDIEQQQQSHNDETIEDSYYNDCKTIISYANQLNSEQIETYWKYEFVDAWRTLIELLFQLSNKYYDKLTFIVELCHYLYERIQSKTDFSQQHVSLLATVYLMAITTLKNELTNNSNLLEYKSKFLIILKELLILINSRFTSIARSCLYSSIARCIELIQFISSDQQEWSTHQDLRRVLIQGLTNNSDLLTILYDDALSVVSAVRSAACSLLTLLSSIDSSGVVLSRLSQTFIRSLESELRQLTSQYVHSLQTQGTVDLKTWHSFSSYMALLLRIASINEGAEILISTDLFDALRPIADFNSDARGLQNDTGERSGRWMFGRALSFVVDLTVSSITNIRTKDRVYQFIVHLSNLLMKLLMNPIDSLCSLHEIDTVLKIAHVLDKTESASPQSTIDWQLQRLRRLSLQLIVYLSRDDLLNRLLSQALGKDKDDINTFRIRQIITATYWRVCFYVFAIGAKMVQESYESVTPKTEQLFNLTFANRSTENSSVSNQPSLNLGMIVSILQEATRHLIKSLDNYDLINENFKEPKEDNNEQSKTDVFSNLIQTTISNIDLTIDSKRKYLELFVNETSYLISTLEAGLYILWKTLSSVLQPIDDISSSRTKINFFQSSHTHQSHNEDYRTLKMALPQYIPVVFLNALITTEERYIRTMNTTSTLISPLTVRLQSMFSDNAYEL